MLETPRKNNQKFQNHIANILKLIVDNAQQESGVLWLQPHPICVCILCDGAVDEAYVHKSVREFSAAALVCF